MIFAVEIETGKSDEIENIRRDLRAGYDLVIIVALNKRVEDKIKDELIKLKIRTKRVKITSTEGFEKQS